MFILVLNAGSKLTVVTSNHLECPLKDMSEITWHGPPELTTVIALNGTVNGHLKSLYEIIVDNSMKTSDKEHVNDDGWSCKMFEWKRRATVLYL